MSHLCFLQAFKPHAQEPSAKHTGLARTVFIHTVYDRLFNDFLARNTVYAPHILYGSGQPCTHSTRSAAAHTAHSTGSTKHTAHAAHRTRSTQHTQHTAHAAHAAQLHSRHGLMDNEAHDCAMLCLRHTHRKDILLISWIAMDDTLRSQTELANAFLTVDEGKVPATSNA